MSTVIPWVGSDPRCATHVVPEGFPECPQRAEAVLAALGAAGWPVDEPGDHPDLPARVAALHASEYLERFRAAAEAGGGWLDGEDNPLGPASWDAAGAAASCALHAVDRVLDGGAAVACAAVRPPGHHAERDRAMGFCFLNNAALAAEHARQRGCGRVAVLDFDVHHGNGTQHLFEERADVVYASVHQFPFYPGTGAADERGRGAGRGATFNVPLPAGCGDAEYEGALRGELLPALAEAEPDLLILSAGFDAYERDPLGGMRVGAAAFRDWGRGCREFADAHTGGRVVVVLEGGYALPELGDLLVGHLAGLAGAGAAKDGDG